MICGFALLNLKNIQEDTFYHPSVQHYTDFFPPHAWTCSSWPQPLNVSLGTAEESCAVIFVTILQGAVGCPDTGSCSALRSCTPGFYHPDTISGGLSSATTTLLSLKKREPELDTLFQLWFHQCQFGGILKLKWEQTVGSYSIHCAPHIPYR